MKHAIDERPLAVASGITPDNIVEFRDHIDYALVATGIGTDFYKIDCGLLRKLANSS